MKNLTTLCQIGDLHREISVTDGINFVVACREKSVVVSEHRKLAAAEATKARKQPHWVQKIYDDRRLLALYIYRRTSANTFEMVS